MNRSILKGLARGGPSPAGCLGWVFWSLAGAFLAGPAGALARDPLLAAEVALTRGEYPEAVRTLGEFARTSPDPAVAERAARVAFDYDQPRELERISADWLARDPKAEAPRRFHAIAELELDHADAAAVDLRVLVKTAYETPAAAFTALQESLGNLDAVGTATDALALLLPEYSRTPEAFIAHGELALRASNSPAAIDSSERALALKPGDREAAWLHARARVLGRDCEQGLGDAAGLAAEGAPRDRLIYAWLLSSCDRTADADGILKDLARMPQLKSEALEVLAGNALEAGRLEEAEARFREALGAGRSPDGATFGLAQVAERRGNNDKAERLYAGITEGGRAVSAQLNLYRLLIQSGEPDLAARVLDEYVQGSPDRVALTTSRAEVLSLHARAMDARTLLERARRVFPDDTGLALTQAAALDRAGRLEDSLALLREEHKARPRDPGVANSLGYTLADHDRELPEAERLIREALAARPDSAAIQDSFGWVLYRQNRPTDAIPWLARAYAADPEPEVAMHLGEAQWASGDREAAARTWTEALKRSPDNPLVREAMARRGVAADVPSAPAGQ